MVSSCLLPHKNLKSSEPPTSTRVGESSSLPLSAMELLVIWGEVVFTDWSFEADDQRAFEVIDRVWLKKRPYGVFS